MTICLSTFLLLVLWLITNTTADEYSISNQLDSNAYGTRFVSNDHMAVLIENEADHFDVIVSVLGSDKCQRFLSFEEGRDRSDNSNIYVINVAVGRNQNSTQLYFIYLMTNKSFEVLSLIVGRIKVDLAVKWNNEHDDYEIECYDDVVDWEDNSHKIGLEPPLLSNMQLDLAGEYAYIFLRDWIYIYNINANNVKKIWTNDLIPPYWFNPHALDVGETSDKISVAIVAGYFEEEEDSDKSLPIVYLVRLDPPSNMILIDNVILGNITVDDDVAFYTEYDYVISVVIHDQTQRVLVSMPFFGRVYLLSFNSTSIVLIRSFTIRAQGIAWIDDVGILAAFLLPNDPTLPWAHSKIQVIDTSTNNGDVIYAYPNNQQSLSPKLNVPEFVRISTTRNHELIVLDSYGWMALVPQTPPGYFAKINRFDLNDTFFEKCPPGTYKNRHEASPCQICPPYTKSTIQNALNGEGATMCVPCSPDSFCPLASVNDVNISLYPAVNDSYVYADVPPANSYDDILINNAFYIHGKSANCISKSPMFWTLMVIAFSLIILIIMGILYYSPGSKIYFNRLRCIFRQTDLIGEGKLWIGGLASFAILVLVVYAFWFGSAFANLYPIETSGDADFACDTSLRNAKFTSALQLLASHKSPNDEPIFNFLDAQNFTLTVDFIQTGFVCNNIRVQEYISSYMVDLKPNDCFVQEDNPVRTISVHLHSHQMNVIFNLTGNSYIGGARVCLTAPKILSNDTLYTAQPLISCQVIFDVNQTLAQTVRINLELTKVINLTESLVDGGPATYSGIWIPRIVTESTSDMITYEQYGSYIRYLASHQIIQVTLKETPFFVKNTQEPIARQGEIIFKDILFSTMCLEFFAFSFLLFKLAIAPLVKRCVKRLHKFAWCRQRFQERKSFEMEINQL